MANVVSGGRYKMLGVETPKFQAQYENQEINLQ